MSREKRRLFKKLTSKLFCLYRLLASHLVKALHELGASAICLGYPLSAAQEEGNEFTSNLWSCRKPMGAIGSGAHECGVKALEVVEYNASEYCAYRGGEVNQEVPERSDQLFQWPQAPL